VKLSSRRLNSELCPNLPKFAFPLPKIDIDNKARFRYQVGYWRTMIYVSICGARDDADTQLTVFGSSALKKQLHIFLSLGAYVAAGRFENILSAR
jgi:hypothetical protein